MYKKILAPLDGSELSECTLSHIQVIASGCKVPEVVLLRVVEPLPYLSQAIDDYIRESKQRVLEFTKTYLIQTAEKLQKLDINTSIAVLEGKPADMILDYIKENKIDLVVMSTNGKSGITRWTVGSVTDKIVRNSGAPVLIVAPAGCRP